MEALIAAGVLGIGYILAQDKAVSHPPRKSRAGVNTTLAQHVQEAPGAELVYDSSRYADLAAGELQARAGQRWEAAQNPESGIVFDSRGRQVLTPQPPHNNMRPFQTIRGFRPNPLKGVTEQLVSRYTGLTAEGFYGAGNGHKHEMPASVFRDTVQQTGLAPKAESHLMRPVEEGYTQPSVMNQGVLPFQPDRVAPGLGGEGDIGFHDPYRILPPTVDALRTKTKPKVSYRGESGPSYATVKRTPAPQAPVVKQKPPRSFNREYVGGGDASVERPASQLNKDMVRPSTNETYEFPAGPTKGVVDESQSHDFAVTEPFRNSDQPSDYMRNVSNLGSRRPGSRATMFTESEKTTYGGDWMHALVAIAKGVLDFDYDGLTIRRNSEQSVPDAREFKNHIDGPEMRTDDVPKDTHRQYMSEQNYAGTPGDPVPEGPDDLAVCNMTTSDRRDVVSRGRAPTAQGVKMYLGIDNTKLDPETRRDLPKERAPRFGGYSRPCKQSAGMDCEYEPIGATKVRRNKPDVVTPRLKTVQPENPLALRIANNMWNGEWKS